MLVTLIVLGLTATVSLGSFSVGDCPKPKVKDEFDLEKFAGTWYEIESTGTVEKMTHKCSNFLVEFKSKNKATVLHKYISKVTGNVKTEHSGISAKSAEPAKLEITPSKDSFLSKKWPLWIVDTDYDSYALAYSCQKKVVTHTDEVFILSRTTKMEDKLKMDLYDTLKKNDIKIKNLVVRDNESKDCEKVHPNSD